MNRILSTKSNAFHVTDEKRWHELAERLKTDNDKPAYVDLPDGLHSLNADGTLYYYKRPSECEYVKAALAENMTLYNINSQVIDVSRIDEYNPIYNRDRICIYNIIRNNDSYFFIKELQKILPENEKVVIEVISVNTDGKRLSTTITIDKHSDI